MLPLVAHFEPGKTAGASLQGLLVRKPLPGGCAPFGAYLHGPRVVSVKPLHMHELERFLRKLPRPFRKMEVVAIPVAFGRIVRPRKVTVSVLLPDDTNLTSARKAVLERALLETSDLQVASAKVLACRRSGRDKGAPLVSSEIQEMLYAVQGEGRTLRLFQTEQQQQKYIESLGRTKTPYRSGALAWTNSTQHGGFEWKGVVRLHVSVPFRTLSGHLLLLEPSTPGEGQSIEEILARLEEQVARSEER